jgi:hypothetical protein
LGGRKSAAGIGGREIGGQKIGGLARNGQDFDGPSAEVTHERPDRHR